MGVVLVSLSLGLCLAGCRSVFSAQRSASRWLSSCLLVPKVCGSLVSFCRVSSTVGVSLGVVLSSFLKGSVSHRVSFCLLSSRVCVSLVVVLSYFLWGLCPTGGLSIFFVSGPCLARSRSVFCLSRSVSCWVSFCLLPCMVCVSLGVVLSSSLQGLCLTGCRPVFFPSRSVSRWVLFCLPFLEGLYLPGNRSVFSPSGSVSRWLSFCLLSFKVCASLRESFCLLPSKVCVSLAVILSFVLQALCLTVCRSVFFPLGSVSHWMSFCLLSFGVCVSMGFRSSPFPPRSVSHLGYRSVFFPSWSLSHWVWFCLLSPGSVSHWASLCLLYFKVCVSLGVGLPSSH